MRARDDGFTLIELMITVLIIGILVAIAIPVFNTTRATAQQKACYSQERLVEGAYNQALSVRSDEITATDWSSLMSCLVPSEIATAPRCPANGTYTWTINSASCSLHGTYHSAH